jgi:predicted enzyme related to lactoylglutathione lyase
VPAEVQAKIDEEIAAGKLDPTAWAMLVPPDGHGPRLLFQNRPKSPTESIPIHLDLNAKDPPAELERLVELGATLVETKSHTIAGYTETWSVLKDPEGNGFCLHM